MVKLKQTGKINFILSTKKVTNYMPHYSRVG